MLGKNIWQNFQIFAYYSNVKAKLAYLKQNGAFLEKLNFTNNLAIDFICV